MKINRKLVLEYVIVLFLATVIFIGTYGIKIINPVYMDVTYSFGDIQQHFLGWQAFRDSDWTFPLGMTNRMTYPDYISTIFTDSIPLFEVIFKVLSPVLPEEFQYFGIWGLGCYVLQAYFSYRIMKKLINDKIYCTLATVLLLFMPIMLHRMFMHEALGGHWIVLFMMDIFFRYEDYVDTKKLYLLTGLNAFFAATVHMYFILLCGIVLLAICIKDILETKKIKRSILLVVNYILIAACCVGVMGGFSNQISSSVPDMYYSFSANLNCFFNSGGISKIFPELGICYWGQGDSMAYLGAGVFFLIAVTLVVIIIKLKAQNETIKMHKNSFIAVGLVILISILFAIFPVVTFNSRELINIPVPNILLKVLANFRCHGRTVWVVVYFLIFGVLAELGKLPRRQIKWIILVLAIAIQIYDIQDLLKEKYTGCNDLPEYTSSLCASDEMENIARDSKIKHVVIGNKFYNDEYNAAYQNEIYVWALKNHKTINNFNLARDDDRYQERFDKATSKIADDTIFILKHEDIDFCKEKQLYYIYIGDFLIAKSTRFQ